MKKPLAIFLVLLMLAVLPLSANAAPSDADDTEVTIIVDGTAYTAHVGDAITYTYYLNLSGLDIGKPGCFSEIEGEVSYQYNGLELLTQLEDEDGNYPALPYMKSGNVFATSFDGEPFRYNAVNLNGYSFKYDKILLQLQFEITGRDDLFITNHIHNLGSDDSRLIYLGETLIEPKTASTASFKPFSRIIGDVDMDRIITILDATDIQLWLCESKALDDQTILNGDFNRDHATDILDVTAIQRMIAGLDYQVFYTK